MKNYIRLVTVSLHGKHLDGRQDPRPLVIGNSTPPKEAALDFGVEWAAVCTLNESDNKHTYTILDNSRRLKQLR